MLSKNEKKELVKKWKESQKEQYILNQSKVQELFQYLEEQLEITPCKHTLHFTKKWLKKNIDPKDIERVIDEMEEMGGYCDCEVLFNCYELYDIV